MKNILFFKKKSHLGKLDPFMWFFNISLGVVNVTIRSLDSQNMIRIPKQSGRDFSVNGYVMDFVWKYYVIFMCGGQYSTEGRMVLGKASLRICHIILFECKGSWMLKTDSLIF